MWASLQGWKKLIDGYFKTNLALNKLATASSFRGNSADYNASMVTDGDKETYWATNDDEKTGSLVIDLGAPKLISFVILQEYIKLGQRVKNFSVEIARDGKWVSVAKGTTIGYKRILRIFPTEAQNIRIVISGFKSLSGYFERGSLLEAPLNFPEGEVNLRETIGLKTLGK